MAEEVVAPGLKIDVLGIEVEQFAAVPTLGIGLRLRDTAGSDVHAKVLRAQVRIEPEGRAYDHDRGRRRQCRYRTTGGQTVIRRFVLSLLFAVMAGLVVRSLPDIARYLRIREM